ncbi:MAG: helix-turn-helix domain-containing protein [Gammaproteobacteria bacterium]
MLNTAILPNHLRPRREKVFGLARGISLDRNAKARIMVYARGWNARHRRPGQHRGPLTRAYLEVLEALLWSFHNSKSGLCFPSYETIAEKAECCRDTVYEAIKALEAAGVLTWVNRIIRQRVPCPDLLGGWTTSWRIIRTSNAYLFRDPLPCAAGRPDTKSENPPGTLNQGILDSNYKKTEGFETMSTDLLSSLLSLGNAIATRETAKASKKAECAGGA